MNVVVSLQSSYSMPFRQYMFVLSKTNFRAIFVILISNCSSNLLQKLVHHILCLWH